MSSKNISYTSYACQCDPRVQQLQKEAEDLRQGQVLSYYFDLCAQPIGNRPVIVSRTNPLNVPRSLCCDKGNQKCRRFDCKQPHWCWQCS